MVTDIQYSNSGISYLLSMDSKAMTVGVTCFPNIFFVTAFAYIYFFCKHCILLSRFILVMLITFMRYTPLKLFSWTPAPSSLHQTNYKQIVYSSVDPDQMAFGIQKEINLGCTRLNCYHYY